MYEISEERISKYYSKYLFKSPKTRILVTVYILGLTLYSTILYLRGTFTPLPLIAIIANNGLLYFVLRKTVIAKMNYTRRFLVLLTYALYLSLIMDALASFIININVPYLITYISSTFIIFILLIPENKVLTILNASLAMVMYYLLLLPLINDARRYSSFVFIFSSLVACLFLAGLYYSISGKVLGVNSRLLAKSFLDLWFAHDPRILENILQKYGVTKNLWVKLYAIVKDNKLKGIFLSTLIHSGPFRNVGSSKYISMFREILEKKLSVPVIIFHTTTTHTNDLVFSSDVAKIGSKIVDEISKQNYIKISSIGPFTVSSLDGYGVLYVPLEKSPMFILFNDKGIDDLPETLSKEVENYVHKLGLKDALVIEAHNSMPPKRRTLENEVKVYNKLIREILHNYRYHSMYPLELGLGEAKDSRLLKCPDVCSDRIYAIAIKAGKEILMLAVVDGNNALNAFRRKVISALKTSLKVSYAELLTTDNHEKTGLITGKHAYVPVGASLCNDIILSDIVEAGRKALADLGKCELRYYRIDFTSKTLGSSGLAFFEKIFSKIPSIVHLLFLFNVIAYIIPIIFLMFL